jgi:hypothetical protein
MTPEAVRDGTKAWCGMPPWPRSYSRSLRMHALCLPPGVAAGWFWSPQLVAIWVVVHPDPASLRKLWQARWKVHSISALTLPRSRS